MTHPPDSSARIFLSGSPPYPRGNRDGVMDHLERDLSAECFRSVLHDWLKELHKQDPGTVIIDEMGICQGRARIDVAVVNGQLHGYEIKSDRDTLRRLRGQCDSYNKVFDRVSVVCGERHISEAIGTIPDWWEVLKVISIDERPRIECIRLGTRNPGRNARSLVEFLWLEEAKALVTERLPKRGMGRKPRAEIWREVCNLFTLDEVAEAVRAHLKATAMIRGRR